MYTIFLPSLPYNHNWAWERKLDVRDFQFLHPFNIFCFCLSQQKVVVWLLAERRLSIVLASTSSSSSSMSFPFTHCMLFCFCQPFPYLLHLKRNVIPTHIHTHTFVYSPSAFRFYDCGFGYIIYAPCVSH